MSPLPAPSQLRSHRTPKKMNPKTIPQTTKMASEPLVSTSHILHHGEEKE